MKRIAIILVALARTAAADPLDDSGTGEAGAAMAGARTAIATGGEAVHVNPAGVARVATPEILVGYHYADNHLALDGRDADVTNASGTTLALALPIANLRAGVVGASGDRIRIAAGASFYLPDRDLARIQLFPTNQPEYIRFGAGQQRIVGDLVVAAAYKAFAIGAGVTMLADTQSRDLTFDVGVKSGEKIGAAHLDIDLPTHMAPIAGVSWRPHPRVELGATVRGQVALDLALDIVANVDVPNVVTGDAKIKLRNATNFTPLRAAIGGAVHVTDAFTVAADLAYDRWSALGSGVPDLQVLVELSLAPPLVASTAVPARWHDTWTPRIGAEWAIAGMRVRGGFAYLPSPVPAQTGITSFADGRRELATLGAGVRIPARWLVAQPIDVDASLGYTHVEHQLVEKDPSIDPGGAFTEGGHVFQIGASATVRFK